MKKLIIGLSAAVLSCSAAAIIVGTMNSTHALETKADNVVTGVDLKTSAYDWSAKALTKDGDSYSVTRRFLSSEAFGFTVNGSNDGNAWNWWFSYSTIYQYAGKDGGSGKDLIETSGENNNTKFKADGYYTITFVASGSTISYVTIAEATVSAVSLKGSGDSWAAEHVFTKQEDDSFKFHKSFAANEEFKLIIDNFWVGYSSSMSDLLSVAANDANMKFAAAGNYEITVSSAGVISFAIYEATNYTVTFNLTSAINDKVVSVIEGDTVDSYIPYRKGYQFNSWKLNNEDYDFDTPVTSSITLIADWTVMEDVSYLYVITGYGAEHWDDTYVYAYNSDNKGDESKKAFGSWPGKKITSICEGVTARANMGGGEDSYWNGGIIKLAVYDDYDSNKIIIHDNNENELELDIVAGAAYFVNSSYQGEYQKDPGLVAELLYDWDALLGETGAICSSEGAFASYTEGEKCAKFSQLYSDYLKVKAVLGDNWLDGSLLTDDDLRVDALANEFYRYTTEKGYTYDDDGTIHEPESLFRGVVNNDNSNAGLIAVISVFGLATAVGSYFYIRKRREN